MSRRLPSPSFAVGELVRFSIRAGQPEIVARVVRCYRHFGVDRVQTIDMAGVDRCVIARRCISVRTSSDSRKPVPPVGWRGAAGASAALSLPA